MIHNNSNRKLKPHHANQNGKTWTFKPSHMLVRKYLKAPRQSRYSFPYERPLTNCPHKAPTMKEPLDKPMEISVLQLERRPADLSEQTTTNNGDTTANQRRFDYVPFHKKILALAIATPLLIRSMRLITVYVGEPKGYASPVPVNNTVFRVLIVVNI